MLMTCRLVAVHVWYGSDPVRSNMLSDTAFKLALSRQLSIVSFMLDRLIGGPHNGKPVFRTADCQFFPSGDLTLMFPWLAIVYK